MLSGPSGKGQKGQKKGEKGRFRPISRKRGQTPLKPPFVTPPFAAAQFKARPVQFGALPAAAEQLFTKPRSRPKLKPNFEALSCFFLKEKPQNSYALFWTWTWLKHSRLKSCSCNYEHSESEFSKEKNCMSRL